MEGPVRRRWSWWQADSSGKWHRWDRKKRTWVEQDGPQFPPPPWWRTRGVRDSEADPFVVYALGVVAALVALIMTAALVEDSSVAAVLAPITSVIAAFAGHAAGHSSAVRAMRH
jgi:hypothetical protein